MMPPKKPDAFQPSSTTGNTPPNGLESQPVELTPEQRLALLTTKLNFYKFLTGSVAVVLITAWLSYLIKDREESLKEVSQDSTNLNNYINIALESSPERQVRLAQFFETLSRDPKTQVRWAKYHKVASGLLKIKQDAEKALNEKQQALKTATGAEKQQLQTEVEQAATTLEIASALAAPPTRFYNTPVLNADADVTTSDRWQFQSFEGGDLAAAHLSLPQEQPRPENVYATLVAPDDKRNWILVWWKRDRSGFTYQYRAVSWDKFNPGNFDLPTAKNNKVPISLGGRGYQQFLFFQATPSASPATAASSPPK